MHVDVLNCCQRKNLHGMVFDSSRVQFMGIKMENSWFTGVKTDFSLITHNSAFDFTFH